MTAGGSGDELDVHAVMALLTDYGREWSITRADAAVWVACRQAGTVITVHAGEPADLLRKLDMEAPMAGTIVRIMPAGYLSGFGPAAS